LSGPIYDGGRQDALTDQARASLAEAVGLYRATVLTAYREVEDNLTALRRLEEESVTEATAVEASRRALDQAQIRYKGGLATYLEVISAQNVYLIAQSSAIDISNRRMASAVGLIQALGGGWEGLNTGGDAGATIATK
jgi:outer membrane protein TolC